MKPRIAVTMGDPAGVGPELCLRLLAEEKLQSVATPIVFGEAAILEAVAKRCRLPMPAKIIRRADFSSGFTQVVEPTLVDFHQVHVEAISPGAVSPVAGAAAFAIIEAAIRSAVAGEVAAIVTAPIHKEALAAAGVPYPGHTEILTSLTGAARSCMMLTAAEITCSLVTAHVGFRDVPQLLHPDRIFDTIELTADAMRRLRGREPRLAVCGLNPHAGEHGLFGAAEEERLIVPAILKARAAGIAVEGPLPADTAFLPTLRASTDAYICMYHDQGLIPLKALAFEEAVNITLGLPIIRTSVDHGTAFDIAWQGRASPTSLYEAFRLAARLAQADFRVS